MPAPKDPARYEEWKRKLAIAHRGKIFSESHKKKIGLANKGKTLGRTHSEEAKRKMSERNRGEGNPMWGKRGPASPAYGRKLSEEAKRKLIIINKGRKRGPMSDEQKEKISISCKGKPGYWKGKKLSGEHVANLIKAHTGKKSHLWRGGISFEPYSDDFTRQLKETIRLRDGYRCQLCGAPEIENNAKLSIHHINYDKKDCRPYNLISLCKKCHIKVNFHRAKWTIYFKKKVQKLMSRSCLQLSLPIDKQKYIMTEN